MKVKTSGHNKQGPPELDLAYLVFEWGASKHWMVPNILCFCTASCLCVPFSFYLESLLPFLCPLIPPFIFMTQLKCLSENLPRQARLAESLPPLLRALTAHLLLSQHECLLHWKLGEYFHQLFQQLVKRDWVIFVEPSEWIDTDFWILYPQFNLRQFLWGGHY